MGLIFLMRLCFDFYGINPSEIFFEVLTILFGFFTGTFVSSSSLVVKRTVYESKGFISNDCAVGVESGNEFRLHQVKMVYSETFLDGTSLDLGLWTTSG